MTLFSILDNIEQIMKNLSKVLNTFENFNFHISFQIHDISKASKVKGLTSKNVLIVCPNEISYIFVPPF